VKRLLPLVGALLGTLIGAQAEALEELYTLTTANPHYDLVVEVGPLHVIAHTDRSCQTVTVDAYLTLYDAAGNTVAQDDDGAHNGATDCVASRLRYEIPSSGYRLRVGSCCGRPYGPVRLEYVTGVPTLPSTSSTLSPATTAPETTTTESTTTTTTTVETTTTSTTSTSVPPETTTTQTTTPETTVATPPPTMEPPTTTTSVTPTTETAATTTTSTSTTTPPTSTAAPTTSAATPAPSSLPSTSLEPTPTTSSPQTTTVAPVIVTDETPIEELAALPIAVLQQLPTEQRKRLEAKINLYSGEYDEYIPTGSRVPIRERRTIIAATTIIAASTAPGPRRRS